MNRPSARSAEAPLTLDGSHGEGGGQLLRTALGLAVALGRPVQVTGIRRRRPRPGLQPQHLTVVRALAAISDGAVVGDELDSTELRFAPRALRGGEYRFDVGAVKGSAGSVSLVLQALLLPLLFADTGSRLTLVGGTHVPWSPPVHYLGEVFLPALAAIGVRAHVELRRWGWYPAGGGEIVATVAPLRSLDGFRPGPPATGAALTGLSAVSRLPRSIAERQRRRAEARLSDAGLGASIAVEEDGSALTPGTLLFLAARGRAGFTGLGRRGLPAEDVADAAVEEALRWAASGASVDEHLADQVLPFLALARQASTFTSPRASAHLETVAWVTRQFLPVGIEVHSGPPARVDVTPATRIGPHTGGEPPLGMGQRSLG